MATNLCMFENVVPRIPIFVEFKIQANGVNEVEIRS